MEDKELINRVRALHFIAGLILHQQNDPRCSVCKSRAKVAEELCEEIRRLESDLQGIAIPEPFDRVYQRTLELVSAIKVPESPIPQRKEGKCFFADQECLVKECFEVYEDLLWEDYRV